MICVNRAGSVPPVSADRRATAQVVTTGNVGINIAGFTHYDGIIFIAGNSTGAADFNMRITGGTWSRFDNCSFRLGGTGVSSRIQIAVGGAYVECNNTTMSFSVASQGITIASRVRWRNTPSALLGTIPTTVFHTQAQERLRVLSVSIFPLPEAARPSSGPLPTTIRSTNCLIAN